MSTLKQTQRKHGGWEVNRERWGSEVDVLVIEALLENDVPRDDPVILRGMQNLRRCRPETTSTVALQTVALYKTNDKQDRELVQRNAEWLLRTAKWDGPRLLGWGRVADSASPLDGSTFDAVVALRSARLAGVRIDARIWEAIRAYCLEGQGRDSGWAWLGNRGLASSPEPTAMAIYGLYAADEMLGESARSARAIERGIAHLAAAAGRDDDQANDFYYAMARLGEVHREPRFVGSTGKKREWFKDGTVWLINRQTRSGTFFIPHFNTARTTATGLLFLAAGK